MAEYMSTHELWRPFSFSGAEEEEESKEAHNEDLTLQLRDHTERFVMSRLHAHAYKWCVKINEEEDAQLMARSKVIASFLTPSSLEIPDSVNNDIMIALARQELLKINTVRTPGDKVTCIVNCVTVIFRTLGLAGARRDGPKVGSSADDFLPVFIWVLLHAQVPELCANCAYIEMYHNPTHLRSKAGYALVNLQSAVGFIQTMEGKSLAGASAGAVTADDFDSKLAAALSV